MYSIYKITCKCNNKVYIGLTKKSPENRFKDHVTASKTGQYDQLKLYRAFKKYGYSEFEFCAIHEGIPDRKSAGNLEIQYIKEYDSVNSGYNTAPGGFGGDIKTPYQKQLLSQKMKGNRLGENVSDAGRERTKQGHARYRNTKKYTEIQNINRLRLLSDSNPGKNKSSETRKLIKDSTNQRHIKFRYYQKYTMTPPLGDHIVFAGKSELEKWCLENDKSMWTIERILLKKKQPKSGSLVGWLCQVEKITHRELR